MALRRGTSTFLEPTPSNVASFGGGSRPRVTAVTDPSASPEPRSQPEPRSEPKPRSQPKPPSQPTAPSAVVQVCLSVVIPPRIAFDPGGSEPRDLAVLREAASILREHPEIRRLAVEGHRNASEPAAVARARAARVEHLMIGEGVDPDRLCLVDEAARKPVADPSTPEGRAKNRRVTFTILEDDAPCDDPGVTR